MSQLGIKTTDEILELGIEKFNEACRESVLKYTGEWRDYVTRQARWVDFDNDYRTLNPDYMESVIWAFKQLHDKGLVYEGFRVLPYCWNDETPLSNHELRMDDDVYQNAPGPGRHRRRPAATTGELGAGLDDDAVDPAVQPRGHGRPGHRLRRGRVRPRPAPPSATSSARRGWRRTPASFGDDADRSVVERLKGSRPARPHLHAAVLLLPRPRERLPRRRRPSSSRPRTAPGWCTAPAPSVRTTRSSPTARASSRSCRSARTARFTHPVDEYAGMLVFDANLPIIDHLKAATRGEAGRLGHRGHGAAAPRDLRPLLPALLALPRAADLQGRLVVVRRGDRDQGADARAQRADPLGARPHQARPVRQVAGERPRLVDHPQPVLGQPGAGVEAATTRRTRGSTSTARSRSSSATSACRDGRPTCTGPFVDELTRPNPDDPTGQVDDAPGPRRARRVVRLRLDVVRPGALPVRERRLVRAPLPGRLHRRVHRPDPRLVLHAAHPGDRALRQPAFSTCVSHGIVLGSDGNKMSKSLRNYPDVYEVFDRDGADAMRWFLMSQPDPARRQPDRHRAGHPRLGAPGADPAVEQLVLLLAVRQRRRGVRRAAWRDRLAPTRSTATCWPSCAQYVEAMTHQLDNYEVANACDSTRGFLDVLTNWYIRRSRERFWASDGDRRHAAPSTRSTPCSRRSAGWRRRCCR